MSRKRRSAAAGLIARSLFERSYCLPVLLNVQLAPGDYLRSYVKCFPVLIRDGDGLGRSRILSAAPATRR
jgi:hypothetical protein